MKKDTKLVNKSDIQKALKLRGPFGWLAVGFLMRVAGFTEEDVSSMLKDESSWDVREAVFNRYGHTQKK